MGSEIRGRSAEVVESLSRTAEVVESLSRTAEVVKSLSRNLALLKLLSPYGCGLLCRDMVISTISRIWLEEPNKCNWSTLLKMLAVMSLSMLPQHCGTERNY